MLRLRVEAAFTPYGTMQLAAEQDDADKRRQMAWRELRRRFESGTIVRGRVLNEVSGGFAVGIASFVALLPAAAAVPEKVSQIGVSQVFGIQSMNDRQRLVVLYDPELRAREKRRY